MNDNTAKFICTVKDGKEVILMGFNDNDILYEKMYNAFYDYGNLSCIYCKIAPITCENKKYVIDL